MKDRRNNIEFKFFKKNKIIFLLVLIVFVGVTFALVTMNVINGEYAYNTTCFNITYDVGEDIMGTLFPSRNSFGGLSGGVNIGIDESCGVLASGNLYLNVDSNTDTKLIEVVSGHCENRNTLETLTDYSDSDSCNSSGNGVWVENGTALKYAVYSNGDEIVSTGYVNKVGEPINIYEDFMLKSSTEYDIYVWLDGELADNSYANLSFSGHISADAKQLPNYYFAEEPVLDEGMIPVVISDDGTVVTVSEDDSSWYSYIEKKWANIVLVNENETDGVDGSKSREYYLNNPGTTVLESDILAYYVWIPRYSYKVWLMDGTTTSNPQTIDIKFESQEEKMKKAKKVGDYMTHPAFWWDKNSDGEVANSEMLPGIWVGKFETTGDADKPTVKPDLQSLREQNVSTQFQTSLKFAGGTMNTSTGNVSFSGNNTYGLTTQTDSHMMKNSEWGAVAYLSHSNYGINEEIYINNSSDYTGRSGGNVGGSVNTPAVQFSNTSLESERQWNIYGYYTWTGQSISSDGIIGEILDSTFGTKASTTGNISGVYDMSGGAYEDVMGHYGNIIDEDLDYSGFAVLPATKYYDLYSSEIFTGDYETNMGLCTLDSCGGDALFETANWYSDYASFVGSGSQWFLRGCDYGDYAFAGAFDFDNSYGGPDDTNISWRSVLVPTFEYEVMFDANGGELETKTEIISYTTSGEYVFTVPYDGKYQLEVWGAQGGSYSNQYHGGYGGYSSGIVSLEKDINLYVNVGGSGLFNSGAVKGGYNGGGSSYGSDRAVGSGGGATHIATISGNLSTLENYKDSILIVAGGGGGAYYENTSNYGSGGYGGGYIGGDSSLTVSSRTYQYVTTGGTQLSGGSYGKYYDNSYPGLGDVSNGSFGQGGTNASTGSDRNIPGGGGGWYGGAATVQGSASGGSGYIGNSLLTDKYMYCYNCNTSNDLNTLTYSTTNVSEDAVANYAKSGNGAAKITFLSSTKDVTFSGKYGELPVPTREGYVFSGWNTELDGNGTVINEDSIVEFYSAHTLYAMWKPKDFNISFNVNGGLIDATTTSVDGNTTYNWTTLDDTVSLDGNSNFYIPSDLNNIDLPNYNDTNYMNISKSGSGVIEGEEWICLDGCSVENEVYSQNNLYSYSDFCDNSSESCNITLGVNWKEIYTISYDANGGSGAPDSQEKLHGITVYLSNVVPTRDGYIFLGWSTLPLATSASYTGGSEFTINDNINLFAVWQEITSPVESYSCANGSVGSEPYMLTYTGDCTVIDDGDDDWRVKFLTSGDLAVSTDIIIDAFLVGGGGGGGYTSQAGSAGGGGGGYTTTQLYISLETNEIYEIVVGDGGASQSDGDFSSAFGVIANGGKKGGNGGGYSYGTYIAGGGGAGGSGGGSGGRVSDSGDGPGGNGGSDGLSASGSGQGTTTREFGEITGTLYSGGGGGGSYSGQSAGSGGSGGGGAGGQSSAGKSGAVNTGGGGGGAGNRGGNGGTGGSGIVVIRNTINFCTGDQIDVDFSYTGKCETIDDGNGNWRVKFLTTGDLSFSSDNEVDVFLVGGGGGGGYTSDANSAGGGGGGYTTTQLSISVETNEIYEIVVGAGGASQLDGAASSAFGVTANGGKKGGNGSGYSYGTYIAGVGGAGGSGGGTGGRVSDNGDGPGGNGGSDGASAGGSGQGTTTREFGESTGTLYAGGGGGGCYTGQIPGTGGSGGGGAGGHDAVGKSGTANTGGGGGGAGNRGGAGGTGGSGIVVIRNAR